MRISDWSSDVCSSDLIPLPAHLLAAADVGDGVDHAAVEQADRGGTEGRVDRVAVAAVGVLQQRGLAVLLEALAVDQRHRHLRTVARGGPGALGGVLRRVVAEPRLLIELAALAGCALERMSVGWGKGG